MKPNILAITSLQHVTETPRTENDIHVSILT